MKDPPEPRLLATLLAVLRHGSMTAAAAALGYVPSAVSQQITRLERQVGVELLCRRPGGTVTPTTAGRVPAEGAADVLAATADFQRLAATVARSGPTEIRLGGYPSVVRSWRDCAQPVTAMPNQPLPRQPSREVLVVTRPRYSHPAVDDLIEILRTAVQTYA